MPAYIHTYTHIWCDDYVTRHDVLLFLSFSFSSHTIFSHIIYVVRNFSFSYIHVVILSFYSLTLLLTLARSLASSLSYNTQFFVFILFFFYVFFFCEFYEWREREREEEEKEKNVFIRRRDAKRLLTDKHQELFVRDIYWDIIFTSLILCFSILFSLLAFRLARLWHFFPDILNTAHIYIICSSLGLETLFSSFPIFFIQLSSFNSSCYCCCWEIRCNLTFSSLSLPLFIFSTAFQDVMCAKGISPLKHMMTYKHT